MMDRVASHTERLVERLLSLERREAVANTYITLLSYDIRVLSQLLLGQIGTSFVNVLVERARFKGTGDQFDVSSLCVAA